ncbi:MAG: response regulator [Myxococcales bacterium]|nr:response regulator [Myxococcales bacterium]
MSDVSCRFFETPLRDLRHRGFDLRRLLDGTGCTLEQLTDKDERVTWSQLVRILKNGRAAWSDADLIRIGEQSTEGPLVQFIGVIARIRFSVGGFYQWVASGSGVAKQMIACVDTSFRPLGPGRCEVDFRLRDGYAPSDEFFLITRGTYAAMPRMLGAPPAAITIAPTSTGVRFEIRYAEPTGALARIRRTVSWPFTMRQAADELADAHDSLLSRYQELDAARAHMAAQARQLTAANRIAALALGDLDPIATMHGVCIALVEHAACAQATITPTEGEAISATTDAAAPDATTHEYALASGTITLGRLRVECDGDAALVESLVPTIALVVQKALDQQALANYQEDLERRVADRTAELTGARDELAASVARLEEAQASRERLFHNISHEIRTPLALVLLLVDGVLAHHRGELTDRAIAQLNSITGSTRKLVRLVDELLLLASGQERDLAVRPEPVDLTTTLPELVAGWTLAAREAGLAFELDVADAGAVMVDPAALERVLANLLSNAIKFTPRGGRIDLIVTRADARTRVVVRDDGPGIDAEFRDRMFERFEQGEAGKRLRAGSGIGLSIARELVRAHGGDLIARANPGGRGTEFEFTLAGTAATAGEHSAPARLLPSDYGVGSTAIAVTTQPPGLSHGHILVAEDDPGLAQAIAALLADEYTVTVAHDGAEALAAATRQLPDLLISDIEMPGLDGLELARQVRSLPGETATPVLIMSARAKLGDRLAGFDAGAVDYLIKPFDPGELRARVRSQLGFRTLAQRLYRTEKLAAMGTLSAGLAHELRNPANGIVNAIQPLRELLPPEVLNGDDGVGDLIDVMQQCAEQVAYVSRQLLGFRRSGDLDLRRVPIADVINRALANAGASLTGVALETTYTYSGPIRCAAPLLTQVLVNLLENAAQAAGPGGWVRVDTGSDDDKARIEISDSGPGVPAALREKVFEPFFTTKPPGQGTGLGLATARDLIQRHQGTLDIRSRDDRTTFVIELPLASEVRR